MFILTDCTAYPRRKYTLNDIKDIGDVVLGMTGDENIAKRAMNDAGILTFGDAIIANPYYIIECVQEEK